MGNRRTQDPHWLTPGELAEQPQFVSTLAHGLAVLGCFGAASPWLGNKELAERLGLSRPTVSRLTFTLTGLGLLRRDDRRGQYALGPAVLTLGYPLLTQLPIRRLARPAMLDLARYAHGAVSIGTRDRLQVVYVETLQGSEASHTRPDIGINRPLLPTAMGRALLHLESPQARARILARLDEAGPGSTDALALERELGRIAERGYSMSWGEWDSTVGAAAVPLCAPVDGLLLAFSVTVPTHLFDRSDFEVRIAPRLVGLVRDLEDQLGLHDGSRDRMVPGQPVRGR